MDLVNTIYSFLQVTFMRMFLPRKPKSPSRVITVFLQRDNFFCRTSRWEAVAPFHAEIWRFSQIIKIHPSIHRTKFSSLLQPLMDLLLGLESPSGASCPRPSRVISHQCLSRNLCQPPQVHRPVVGNTFCVSPNIVRISAIFRICVSSLNGFSTAIGEFGCGRSWSL